MTTAEHPQLMLRGLRKRGAVLGAVLALEGAKSTELKRASAIAAMLADRSILVAVDGGLRTCRLAGRRPDLFVGDGDSQKRVPTDVEVILFDQDKDFSDLCGTLEELKRRRVQVVTVAGLLGGRLDHEWANLQELGSRARGFAGLIAPTGRGLVIVSSHGCWARTVRGRTFSVFPLGAMASVTLQGGRWALQRCRLRPGSHGLSNLTGTELDLTVHRGTVALILIPDSTRRKRVATAASRAALRDSPGATPSNGPG